MKTPKNTQPHPQQTQQHITSPIKQTPKRIYQTIYGSRFMRNSKQLVPLCNNTSNISTNTKTNINININVNINSTVRSSSDYYTFQQSMINAKVKNNCIGNPSHLIQNNINNTRNNIHIRNNNINNIHHSPPTRSTPTPSTNPQNFRKTYSIQKPSTSRIALQQQRTSNTKLTGVSTVKIQRVERIERIQKITGKQKIQRIQRKQIKNISTTNLNMHNTTTGFGINKTNNTQKNLISYVMNNTSCNFRPSTNSHDRKFINNNLAEDFKNYLSKYQIIRELGKGTYGVVHLARNKRDEKEKLQENKSQNLQEEFLSAYNVLKQEQRKDDILKESIRKQSIQVQNHEQNKQTVQNQSNINISLDQIHNITQDHRSDSPHKKQSKQQQQLSCSKLIKLPQTKTIHHIQQTKQTTLYAIKIYQKFKVNKDPTKFKNIRKQINIMQNIDHPNIIKLYQSVDTLTKINLVVQYGGNLSLLDYLKQNYPLSQNTMRNIGKQLLQAIVYLHDKNIVHRDLKLQNILMMDNKVKIIDFGFSTLTYKNRKLNAICGTPNYMAPQLLSKKQYIGQYADIWSYGVIMYTIAQGKHPFKADNYNELDRLVNKGVYQFKRITNSVHQAFIKRILKVKPQQRPNGRELLGHPWLNICQEPDDQPDE